MGCHRQAAQGAPYSDKARKYTVPSTPGCGLRKIVGTLNRSPSTISRELGRESPEVPVNTFCRAVKIGQLSFARRHLPVL